MRYLSPILNPEENILVDLDVLSLKRLFEEAAKVLSPSVGVPAQSIFDALIAREKLGSTGLGNSVAIPHARIGNSSTPSLCLVRTKEPIACAGPNQKEARLFFVVAISETAPDAYLDILREVAELVQDTGMLETLLEEKAATDIASFIRAWELASPEA